MFSKLIDKLFGRAVEPLQIPPATPIKRRYSFDDPRHPINARDGWYRTDLPQGRRVRRFEFGDPPRTAPPVAGMTGAEYLTGGIGHVDDVYGPRAASTRPSPPPGPPMGQRADAQCGRMRG